MEISVLPEDVRAILRSGININSAKQCVSELILNSLDAKSTAIAVRINLSDLNIEVVDNGNGICEENLRFIGSRYMTTKCKSLNDLSKKVRYYGYRGEALSSIRNISKKICISSRLKGETKTFCIELVGDKSSNISVINERPSKGTTVRVEELFHNMPVRRNRINLDIDIEEIRECIETIAIIHPKVSFSLRNDLTRKIIFNTHLTRNVRETLTALFKDIYISQLHKCKIFEDTITVTGLLYRGTVKSHKRQYIYVNKRPVYCKNLESRISDILSKSSSFKTDLTILKRSPVFVINIICSHTNYDYILNTNFTKVDFKNWEIVFNCVDNMFCNFIKNDLPVNNIQNKSPVCIDDMTHCGVSQLSQGFKSGPIKRKKLSKSPDVFKPVCQNDSPSIIESTQQNIKTKKLKISSPLQIRSETINNNEKIKTIKNYYCDFTSIKEEPKEATINFHDSIFPKKCRKSRKNKLKIKYERKPIKNKNDNLEKIFMEAFKTDKKIEKITKETNIVPDDLTYLEDANINNNDNKCLKTYDLDNKSNKGSAIDNSMKSDEIQDSMHSVNDDCVENKNIKQVVENQENSHGKNLIMEMFLRSTQIYKNQNDITIPNIQKDEVSLSSINNPSDDSITKDMDIVPHDNYSSNINLLSMNVQTKSVKHTLNKTFISIYHENRFSPPLTHGGKNKLSTVQFSTVRKNLRQCQFENQSEFQEEDCLNNEETFVNTSIMCNDISKYFMNKIKKYESCKNQPENTECKIKVRNKTASHLDYNNEKQLGNKYLNSICKYNQILDLVNPEENYKGNCHIESIDEKGILDKDSNKLNFINETLDMIADITYKTFNSHSNYKMKNICKANIFKQQRSEPIPKRNLEKKCLQRRSSSHNKIIESTPKTKTSTVMSMEKDSVKLDQLSYKNFEEGLGKIKSFANDAKTERAADSEKNISTDIFKSIYNNSFLLKPSGYDITIPTELLNTTNKIENQSLLCSNNIGDTYCNTMNCPSLNANRNLFYAKRKITETHENVLEDKVDSTNISVFKEPNILQDEFNFTSDLFLNEQGNASRSFPKKTILTDQNKDNSLEYPHNQLDNSAKWVETMDKNGNKYYINKESGMTSILTPKNKTNFSLKKRSTFIPKGQSPIIKDYKEVDTSLASDDKKELHRKLFEQVEQELQSIKWEMYLKYKDPKVFFDEIYKEINKKYEKLVPDLSKENYLCKLQKNISGNIFKKEMFSNLHIIGQLDKKFIVCFLRSEKMLVFFDQHAVHERIRVEDLFRKYLSLDRKQIESVQCNKRLYLPLKNNDIQFLSKNLIHFENIGLSFLIKGDNILFEKIPTCIYNKWQKTGLQSETIEILKTLIEEEIEIVKQIHGISTHIPKIIQDTINIEACRGAIKFGTYLTLNECKKYIKELSVCKLPFQCAHGRPTLVPIIKLNIEEGTQEIPRLYTLRKTKKS